MESKPSYSPPVCPYCAGKGGRYRLVYSVFAGVDAQVHQGAWQTCWNCKGTGVGEAQPPHPHYAELAHGS